jgi:uncharacterized protein YceH (UPF0502 family)
MAANVLADIGNGKVSLPKKLKVRIAVALRKLGVHQKDYEKARQMVIAEHTQTDEKGETLTRTVTHENGPQEVAVLRDPMKADEEVRELLATEVEVGLAPFTLEELADPRKKGETLGSAEQLAALGPFLLLEDAPYEAGESDDAVDSEAE